MIDPFGSLQGMMSQFSGFMQNPLQYMMQRKLQLPQNIQDPNEAIQYLMNTGKMSQQDYNQLRQMATQLQNNPQFMQMFGRKL